MTIKQISVFLDNRPGRILELVTVLEKAELNIHALYVADTAEYGILRMIVDCPEQAAAVLKEEGFTVRITDVIAIVMTDRPGGLRAVLEAFRGSGVSIEYMYAFTSRNEREAAVVLKVSDLLETEKLIKNSGIRCITQSEVGDLWNPTK